MTTKEAQQTFDALKHIPINVDDIEDIEFDGIGGGHDQADAFICNARWISTGKPLTGDELDQLSDDHPDFTYDRLTEHLY
jgi:hypothetical protein